MIQELYMQHSSQGHPTVSIKAEKQQRRSPAQGTRWHIIYHETSPEGSCLVYSGGVTEIWLSYKVVDLHVLTHHYWLEYREVVSGWRENSTLLLKNIACQSFSPFSALLLLCLFSSQMWWRWADFLQHTSLLSFLSPWVQVTMQMGHIWKSSQTKPFFFEHNFLDISLQWPKLNILET